MKKRTVIIESIFVAIFVALILISLIFASGAIFGADFAVKFEYYIQKTYALYDFNIVNVSTIIAIISSVIVITGLVLVDNRIKGKRKKIVRR